MTASDRLKQRTAERDKLKAELSNREISYEDWYILPRLQDLVDRDNRGLLRYTNCRKPELVIFARQRRLIKTTTKLLLAREKLISLLEAADNDFLFEHFFELPAEIRNMIYELALTTDDCNMEVVHVADPESWRRILQQTSLLEASPLLRQEALPLFYATRVVAFRCYDDVHVVEAMMKRVGLDSSTGIRRLFFRLERATRSHENNVCGGVLRVRFNRSTVSVDHNAQEGCEGCERQKAMVCAVETAAEQMRKASGGMQVPIEMALLLFRIMKERSS